MTSNLPPRLAAIDLGTNTFRLVTRGLQMVEYPRIGHGVDRTGRIAAASIRRGMATLSKFAQIVRRRRLRVVGVVGTSALRDAGNGPAFCEAVRRRFGWDVQIISGEEEAMMTFTGATSTLKLHPGHVLVSDVGGGSTELVWGAGKKIHGRVSLKLGSVRMTERFDTAGRSAPRKIETFRRAVRTILKSARVPWREIKSVVGVGGTATTLAAILHGVEPYDEKQVHGAAVPVDSMEKMIDVLSTMTPRERMFLPCVPKGRSDIIVAGTVIQTEIVRRAGAGQMIASDAGILTGLILRQAQDEREIHHLPRGYLRAKNPVARRRQKV